MAFFDSLVGMCMLTFAVFAFVNGAYITYYGRRTSRAIGILSIILGMVGVVAIVSSTGIMYLGGLRLSAGTITNGVASVLGMLLGVIVPTLLLFAAMLKS